MGKRVLIGIMTKNRRRMLMNALHSILNQKYDLSNVGVIVCPNDCIDDTIEHLDLFKEEYGHLFNLFCVYEHDFGDTLTQYDLTNVNVLKLWEKHAYFKNEIFFPITVQQGYDFFFSVHDDVYLPNVIMQTFTEFLCLHPKAGVVGPLIVNKPGYCPMFPFMHGKVLVWRTDGTNLSEGGNLSQEFNEKQFIEVRFVACAWMIKKEIAKRFKLTILSGEYKRSAHSKFYEDIRADGYKIYCWNGFVPHYYENWIMA